MEGAGGTSGLNTGWREFGFFQIDRHARLTFFFVGHLQGKKSFHVGECIVGECVLVFTQNTCANKDIHPYQYETGVYDFLPLLLL